VGWGRGKTSWSIDAGELPGDTADLDDGPWDRLSEILARAWPREGGGSMSVRMAAIDSGYNTQSVYAYCRQHSMSKVVAIKGQDHGNMLVGAPSKVDVTSAGRPIKAGGRVWPIAVGMAKSELYGWLNLERPTEGEAPAGYCHFPQYGENYFKELTAEHLVTHQTRRGYVRLDWEQIPGRQNHALDARVYARAAAAIAQLDRYSETDWDRLDALARPKAEKPEPKPTPARAVEPSPAKRPAASGGGWLGPARNDWLGKRGR
jgi:phage terminase large subunit GpA-like protein